MFQAITKPKANEPSPAKRGRGGRGYKGKFNYRGGRGRGQFTNQSQGFNPNYQQFTTGQWAQTPPNPNTNQQFLQQGFGVVNPYSVPFNTNANQGASSQPRGRGRGRGKQQ